jgi:hypothetical protein
MRCKDRAFFNTVQIFEQLFFKKVQKKSHRPDFKNKKSGKKNLPL